MDQNEIMKERENGEEREKKVERNRRCIKENTTLDLRI